MATVTIEAIYEDGLLRLTEPLNLLPNERVTVTVQCARVSDWPEDTEEIYRESEMEDRELANAMLPGLRASWPLPSEIGV